MTEIAYLSMEFSDVRRIIFKQWTKIGLKSTRNLSRIFKFIWFSNFNYFILTKDWLKKYNKNTRLEDRRTNIRLFHWSFVGYMNNSRTYFSYLEEEVRWNPSEITYLTYKNKVSIKQKHSRQDGNIKFQTNQQIKYETTRQNQSII